MIKRKINFWELLENYNQPKEESSKQSKQTKSKKFQKQDENAENTNNQKKEDERENNQENQERQKSQEEQESKESQENQIDQKNSQENQRHQSNQFESSENLDNHELNNQEGQEEVSENTKSTNKDTKENQTDDKDDKNSEISANSEEKNQEVADSNQEGKKNKKETNEQDNRDKAEDKNDVKVDDIIKKLLHEKFNEYKLKLRSDNYQRNSVEAFDLHAEHHYSKEYYILKSKLIRLFELLTQEEEEENTEGTDFIDFERYIFKPYEKRPLDAYKYGLKRGESNIKLILDNSGSCEYYANTIISIARIAEKLDFVEIYLAPNGDITKQIKNGKEISVSSDFYWDKFPKDSKIIFFGDFDGGDILVEASWKYSIVWLCCEARYEDLYEHSWNEYSLSDFKGLLFYVYDEKDILNVVKSIEKNMDKYKTKLIKLRR